MGASKIAETAKENATRLGNIASQKVSSKLLYVFCFILIFVFYLKLREGGIVDDVGSHVTDFASKVCNHHVQ